MRAVWQDAALVGLALVVGALAYLLFGPSPAALEPAPANPVAWQLVESTAPDLAASDGRWESFAPWGAPPRVVETEAPPPPAVPVGISREGGRAVAIFLVPGAGEVRVAPGASLPDGGQVRSISGMRVAWTDGQGQDHEREMFTGLTETARPDSSAATPATSTD